MNVFKNINKVTSSFLGNTPAAVNLDNGDLYLNTDVWNALPKEHKVFILLHEAGHYLLQTEDEHEADAFAFENYSKLGYSLKESIFALSENLTGESQEHMTRLEAQALRAKKYDYYVNGNAKALSNYQGAPDDSGNSAEWEDANSTVNSVREQLQSIKEFDQCADLKRGPKRRCIKKRNKQVNGLNKALSVAIKKRNSKMAMRSEVRKGRNEVKGKRADGRALKKAGKGDQLRSRGEADRILAEQGIDSQANRRSAIMDGLGGIAKSIMGGGAADEQGGAGDAGGTSPTIIIVVVVVIAAVFFIMSKKKK